MFVAGYAQELTLCSHPPSTALENYFVFLYFVAQVNNGKQ